MRSIEQQMNSAIKARKDWYLDNTTVMRGDALSSVFLYGHQIAIVLDNGDIHVNRAVLERWPTNTTISRLRALGADVQVRNRCVMLNGVHITTR